MSKQIMKPKDYLKKPYARRLIPDESGGFVATIQEFPGCIAEGDTSDEALLNLEKAATSWAEVALSLGQEIPEPLSFHGYSGKIALRIPRGLHKQAAEMAESEGTSLNQFLISAIARYVGERGASKQLTKEFLAEVRKAITTTQAAEMRKAITTTQVARMQRVVTVKIADYASQTVYTNLLTAEANMPVTGIGTTVSSWPISSKVKKHSKRELA